MTAATFWIGYIGISEQGLEFQCCCAVYFTFVAHNSSKLDSISEQRRHNKHKMYMYVSQTLTLTQVCKKRIDIVVK